MKRFIEGADRNQSTLLPECLDDWIDESNPVRVVDAFVDALDPSRNIDLVEKWSLLELGGTIKIRRCREKIAMNHALLCHFPWRNPSLAHSGSGYV
jgi:transposase